MWCHWGIGINWRAWCGASGWTLDRCGRTSGIALRIFLGQQNWTPVIGCLVRNLLWFAVLMINSRSRHHSYYHCKVRKDIYERQGKQGCALFNVTKRQQFNLRLMFSPYCSSYCTLLVHAEMCWKTHLHSQSRLGPDDFSGRCGGSQVRHLSITCGSPGFLGLFFSFNLKYLKYLT